ncbi:serine carboxypeptidase s28 domain-containing protein [Ditylenchus destructor]|uniref:Serine carboxypeptidase s28 domain-containing protein n=1 Tax=Ditylenchus destructor TaxID=166010 RepID=A0AAD4NEL2_9BILA|nr:serine carboxypeptidase s28 domain-containing protein [Ditylenchus destructor]
MTSDQFSNIEVMKITFDSTGHTIKPIYHGYSSGTCTDIFGPEYDLQSVRKAIEQINNFYGGTDKFNATNVIFINGSEDPWRTASIIKSSPNNAYISLNIEGSSHCRDMFRPSSTNFPALNWAHNVTSTEISKWIAI